MLHTKNKCTNWLNKIIYWNNFVTPLVQLDGGQFQEQSQEYVRWKEWRDKVAVELRQSVSIYLYLQYQNDTNNFRNNISATIFLIYSFQFTNLKLQTSNLANEHLDRIKSLKDLQFRILDQVNILTLYSITYYILLADYCSVSISIPSLLFQELNTWKREQQLAGNGAPFSNNLDTIQKW